MAAHSSILAGKNPTDTGAGRATACGVENSQTQLSMHSIKSYQTINYNKYTTVRY